jgi:hypothetical protein
VSFSSGSPLLRPFTDYYPGAVSRASQSLNLFGYQWPCRDPGGMFSCGSTVARSTDKFRQDCHRLSRLRLDYVPCLRPALFGSGVIWWRLQAARMAIGRGSQGLGVIWWHRRVTGDARSLCTRVHWGHLVAARTRRGGFAPRIAGSWGHLVAPRSTGGPRPPCAEVRWGHLVAAVNPATFSMMTVSR